MKTELRPIGGHVLDIDSSELSDQHLSLAKNVNMRKGFPARIRGRRSTYNPPLPLSPYHLLNFPLAGFNWWLMFGTNTIYAFETSNEYDISMPAQIAIANPYEWSSTLLNGIPCFTNGKQAPHYWNGNSATDAVALPGWPANTTCRFIVAFRFHLFALNITNNSGEFDNLILWSDATEPGAVPTTWTPAANNEAGSAFLADTAGRAIAGSPLATQLMIYKPSSFYAIEYAGQPPDNIFIVRPVVRSTGLLSPHALKTIGQQQAVVGNDDVVLTDGVNTRSIADNRVRISLSSSIDETNAQNVFTIWDQNNKELWVCMPESGNQFANIAHIWNGDRWVTRDLNAVKYGAVGLVNDIAPSQAWSADTQSWDSDLTSWNETQQGGTEKVVLAETSAMYVEDVAGSTLYNCILQRLDLTFGDAEQIKVTSRVYIDGTGALNSLQFRLGFRNSVNDSLTWGPYASRQVGGKEYEITGRFISIEIVNSTTSDAWMVTRIRIEAESDGEF